jgi:predicted AlkP superfamily phosphohydrolase/phosphomutase
VSPEEYDGVRNAIRRDLEALRGPAGDRVLRQVLTREELYWPPGARRSDPRMPREKVLDGKGPFGRGPDLVALPNDGYDLKMGLGASDVFVTTELEGMHTFGDAMILSRGVALPTDRFAIYHVARRLCEALGVAPPEDMD